jgi:hypothetical protein
MYIFRKTQGETIWKKILNESDIVNAGNNKKIFKVVHSGKTARPGSGTGQFTYELGDVWFKSSTN